MPAVPPPSSSGRLAVFAVIVCVLALAAAGVSFARGSFLGIIWIMLAGVSSNIAWYYLRKAKVNRETAQSN